MNKFEKRNFNIYLIGMFVSLLGTQIQFIAMPLFILDRTGSGSLTGIFTFMLLFPFMAVTPFAGVIGDRLNRKNIMVNMDLARGAMVMFLAVYAFMIEIPLVLVFVFQGIISVMDGFFSSSTSAMRADLVQPKDYALTNSKVTAMRSIAGLIGPAVGGMIYAFGGIGVVFLINALTFIISGFAEIFIKYNPEHIKDKEKMTVKKFASDIKEGYVFIMKQKGLKNLLFFASFSNFVLSPMMFVLFPYLFKEVIGFSGSKFGFVQAGFTAGALVGSILFSKFLINKSGKTNMTLGLGLQIFVGFAIGYLVLPATVNMFGGTSWAYFGVIIATMISWGIFNIWLNIPLQTNIQKMAPSYIRSRVFSVLELIFQGAVPIGSVIYGFMLDSFAPHKILIAAMSIGLVLALIFLFTSPKETFDPELPEEEVNTSNIKEKELA
ncbi:MAG: MFS transporter [Thermotogota bacterium]